MKCHSRLIWSLKQEHNEHNDEQNRVGRGYYTIQLGDSCKINEDSTSIFMGLVYNIWYIYGSCEKGPVKETREKSEV